MTPRDYVRNDEKLSCGIKQNRSKPRPNNETIFPLNDNYSVYVTSIPNEESWKDKVFSSLKNNFSILGYPSKFIITGEKLLFEIFNYLKTNHKENYFIYFMNNFRVSDPIYFSNSLTYIILKKHLIQISQTELALKLNVKITAINECLYTLYKFLKKTPEENLFILSLLKLNQLLETDFIQLFQHYAKNYFKFLEINFNISFNIIEDIDHLLSILHSVIKNNYTNFCNHLNVKNTKIVASSLCYIFVVFFKNARITQKDFITTFNKCSSYKINYGKFSELYSYFILNFNIFCKDTYSISIDSFLEDFLEDLSNWKHLNPNSIGEFDKIYYLNFMIELKNTLLKTGFKIVFVSKSKEIHYYFPQTFALTLICFTFRLKELFTFNSSHISEIFNYNLNNRYIIDKKNRLYPFIRNNLGRLQSQTYSKEDFIEILNSYIKEFFHSETSFILDLFNSCDLTPQNFAKLIGYRSGRLTSLIEVAKKNINFILPNTFNKFENFIYHYIPLNLQDYFISDLDNLKQTRHKEFVQNNIRYDFQCIPSRVKKRNNVNLQNILLSHLKKLLEGELPDAFFNFTYNPRVSGLFLKGIRKPDNHESLSSSNIDKFLFKPLLNKGRITVYDNSFFLCKITKEFINIYNKKYYSIPNHTPILRNILKNQLYSYSIETPVWLYLSNRKEYLTGHIDLTLTKENIIFVSDYKTSKEEMIRSLPQISTYGLLLKHNLLGINNSFNFEIKCITFSKDLAFIYNPNILQSEILNFIKLMNEKRENRLMDKFGNDLEEIIKDIIISL